jgi:LysR family transcriptional regulator, nod-box dependent transcriptional activator
MHLNRLDLNLLVALDALLTEQNVTRAAERMHVSQPAMSGSLQRLRVHLNDPLLESAGNHRLKLTPRARRLVGPVKDLLTQIESTLSGQPDFDPSTAEQEIHLAMSSYCAHVLGSRLIADIRQHAPKMKCRIHEISEHSISGVSNGDFDFCITLAERSYLDPASQHMQLRAETVFTDRFVIAAAAQNTDVAQSLSLEKYRRLPLVEVRVYGHCLSVPERAIACYDKPANTVAVVPSFHLALAAVSGTSMVAIVPALLAEALAKALDIKWYEPDFRLPECCEALIWHERNAANCAHVWMRQRVKWVAASLARGERANKRDGARPSVIS